MIMLKRNTAVSLNNERSLLQKKKTNCIYMYIHKKICHNNINNKKKNYYLPSLSFNIKSQKNFSKFSISQLYIYIYILIILFFGQKI